MSDTPLYLLERIRQAKERRLKDLDLTNDEFSRGDPGLTSIPDELLDMDYLESLNLRRNSLTSLSDSIANLRNLTSLNLSFNRLSAVPESIFRLSQLQSLDLSLNAIDTVPEGIEGLRNLTSLDLSHNRLAWIPDSFYRLPNLTSLDLSANELSLLSSRIAALKSLQVLRLSDNSLEQLPEGIYELRNLKQLELDETLDEEENRLSEPIYQKTASSNSVEPTRKKGNRILELSPKILQLQCLERFSIATAALEVPPPEIVGKGLDGIKNYFKQIEAQGKDYLYEAKLLIIGEGGSGKTTLARKIEDPDYKLQDEDSTKGIEVRRWSFELPDGKPFRVNIWDFGGQEIYHATHQFFLTKRSLYVLVADTRKEDTDFHYWLNVVELLSENSPLLIVKNEKQDRTREINERQLRGQFSNLKESLATNLATDRGFAEILKEIKHHICGLPHIGTPLPKTWVKVRQALEDDARNYMSLDEYLGICERHGFTDIQDKLQLSSYLHDLGVCLHFQEDPLLKKTIILKPRWGTDAVYKVLDNVHVIRHLGRFTRRDLAVIWHKPEYANMEGELLQLMIKFKLCYQIKNSEFYIAPQLLTENQPDYQWNDSDNLILRYTYEFMPKGIITQFIVAMHTLIAEQKLVWRTGVILVNENTEAEIIQFYASREIRIRIAGEKRRELMTIVNFVLDDIHSSYKNLKYVKLIPCNCEKCRSSQQPHFYRQETLQRFADHRQDLIMCEMSFEMVNVCGLIDDVIDKKEYASYGRAGSSQSGQQSVFISYSHLDVDWLEKLQVVLKPLVRSGQLSVWADTSIQAGSKWRDEVKLALVSAKVAVLLVSPNFLASDFIAEYELTPLLAAAEQKGLTILWVPVSHSMYKETDVERYQAASDPSKPLDSLSPAEANRVMVRICEQIKEAASS